jgi:hypothetical protein
LVKFPASISGGQRDPYDWHSRRIGVPVRSHRAGSEVLQADSKYSLARSRIVDIDQRRGANDASDT